MKKLFAFIILIIISNVSYSQDAKSILLKTINEHGGFDKLSQVERIKFNYIGHKNWIEQSERPEGPYLVSYEEGVEIVDWNAKAILQEIKTKHIQFKEWTSQKIKLTQEGGSLEMFGREMPVNKMYSEETELSKYYHPEFVLLQAYHSKNLNSEKEEVLQSKSHYVLSFTSDEIDFRLLIKKSNYLISAIDIQSKLKHSFFFSPFEKFTTRVYYSIYSFLDGGIRYPMQWDISRLERPWKSMTILDFEINPILSDSTFFISENVKQLSSRVKNIKIEDWPIKPNSNFDLATTIKGLSNSWNVGWVEQSDGIVVIEAPMSSGYSQKIKNHLKEIYPNKKIKGVICTSDAFPHLGGIKYYVDKPIPIYSHSLNKSTINLISQNNTIKNLNLVDKKINFEDATTPFQIIPINGEGGERYLALYFPKQKVLYTSDLVFKPNKQTGEYFMPQYMTEIIDLVERENLEVENIFGMHLPPTPYNSIEKEIQRIGSVGNFSKSE